MARRGWFGLPCWRFVIEMGLAVVLTLSMAAMDRNRTTHLDPLHTSFPWAVSVVLIEQPVYVRDGKRYYQDALTGLEVEDNPQHRQANVSASGILTPLPDAV